MSSNRGPPICGGGATPQPLPTVTLDGSLLDVARDPGQGSGSCMGSHSSPGRAVHPTWGSPPWRQSPGAPAGGKSRRPAPTPRNPDTVLLDKGEGEASLISALRRHSTRNSTAETFTPKFRIAPNKAHSSTRSAAGGIGSSKTPRSRPPAGPARLEQQERQLWDEREEELVDAQERRFAQLEDALAAREAKREAYLVARLEASAAEKIQEHRRSQEAAAKERQLAVQRAQHLPSLKHAHAATLRATRSSFLKKLAARPVFPASSGLATAVGQARASIGTVAGISTLQEGLESQQAFTPTALGGAAATRAQVGLPPLGTGRPGWKERQQAEAARHVDHAYAQIKAGKAGGGKLLSPLDAAKEASRLRLLTSAGGAPPTCDTSSATTATSWGHEMEGHAVAYEARMVVQESPNLVLLDELSSKPGSNGSVAGKDWEGLPGAPAWVAEPVGATGSLEGVLQQGGNAAAGIAAESAQAGPELVQLAPLDEEGRTELAPEPVAEAAVRGKGNALQAPTASLSSLVAAEEVAEAPTPVLAVEGPRAEAEKAAEANEAAWAEDRAMAPPCLETAAVAAEAAASQPESAAELPANQEAVGDVEALEVDQPAEAPFRANEQDSAGLPAKAELAAAVPLDTAVAAAGEDGALVLKRQGAARDAAEGGIPAPAAQSIQAAPAAITAADVFAAQNAACPQEPEAEATQHEMQARAELAVLLPEQQLLLLPVEQEEAVQGQPETAPVDVGQLPGNCLLTDDAQSPAVQQHEEVEESLGHAVCAKGLFSPLQHKQEQEQEQEPLAVDFGAVEAAEAEMAVLAEVVTAAELATAAEAVVCRMEQQLHDGGFPTAVPQAVAQDCSEKGEKASTSKRAPMQNSGDSSAEQGAPLGGEDKGEADVGVQQAPAAEKQESGQAAPTDGLEAVATTPADGREDLQPSPGEQHTVPTGEFEAEMAAPTEDQGAEVADLQAVEEGVSDPAAKEETELATAPPAAAESSPQPKSMGMHSTYIGATREAEPALPSQEVQQHLAGQEEGKGAEEEEPAAASQLSDDWQAAAERHVPYSSSEAEPVIADAAVDVGGLLQPASEVSAEPAAEVDHSSATQPQPEPQPQPRPAEGSSVEEVAAAELQLLRDSLLQFAVQDLSQLCYGDIAAATSTVATSAAAVISQCVTEGEEVQAEALGVSTAGAATAADEAGGAPDTAEPLATADGSVVGTEGSIAEAENAIPIETECSLVGEHSAASQGEGMHNAASAGGLGEHSTASVAATDSAQQMQLAGRASPSLMQQGSSGLEVEALEGSSIEKEEAEAGTEAEAEELEGAMSGDEGTAVEEHEPVSDAVAPPPAAVLQAAGNWDEGAEPGTGAADAAKEARYEEADMHPAAAEIEGSNLTASSLSCASREEWELGDQAAGADWGQQGAGDVVRAMDLFNSGGLAVSPAADGGTPGSSSLQQGMSEDGSEDEAAAAEAEPAPEVPAEAGGTADVEAVVKLESCGKVAEVVSAAEEGTQT